MTTKTVAIAAGTAAADSSAIVVEAGETIRVRTELPLEGDESVTVSTCDDDGSNPMKYQDGGSGGYRLNASHSVFMLNGPGAYLLHKSATASAKAVIVDS